MYFQEQETRGVTYESSDTAISTRPSSSAPLSRASTSEVGFVRPPANFKVLNLQAQHMIIHDSSSGQLVEATVPSIDFSRSVALQNILHPQASSSQSSSSRVRNNSPPRLSRPRSHRRWSPSPGYCPCSISVTSIYIWRTPLTLSRSI
jgi:hypothetical protein